MSTPISSELIRLELDSAVKIVQKWLMLTQQIPGQDAPASEDQAHEFLRQLAGELLLVARKCETLAALVVGE